MPSPDERKPIETQNTVLEPVPSSVRDRRTQPEGALPKQAQGYVIAGLAILILLAVMFSKSHQKPAAKETTAPPVAVSDAANQRKIRELEQDLSANQREVLQTQKATTSPSSFAGNSAGQSSSVATAPVPPATPVERPRDPVADAEREIAFKARFASNLIEASNAAARPSAVSGEHDEAIEARAASASPSSPVNPTSSPSASTKRAPEVNVNAAHGQPYVIFEGTTIDTVLANRLDGEFAGPVKVMVTNPVYSRDRQHVLIPEGSFILGDVQKVSNLGQKRLAVTFHRLLMPDGYSVDLDQFHGLDQIGDTGLKDKVNNHYLQIFGTSIALGVIAGAAEATNSNAGYNMTGVDAYKSGVASSLSQSSANVLDRFINIPPTITIREGHRVRVYITQDMLLPAYENHTVPGDI